MKRKRMKYTDQEVKKVIKLREKGMDFSEIKEKFSLSNRLVRSLYACAIARSKQK